MNILFLLLSFLVCSLAYTTLPDATVSMSNSVQGAIAEPTISFTVNPAIPAGGLLRFTLFGYSTAGFSTFSVISASGVALASLTNPTFLGPSGYQTFQITFSNGAPAGQIVKLTFSGSCKNPSATTSTSALVAYYDANGNVLAYNNNVPVPQTFGSFTPLQADITLSTYTLGVAVSPTLKFNLPIAMDPNSEIRFHISGALLSSCPVTIKSFNQPASISMVGTTVFITLQNRVAANTPISITLSSCFQNPTSTGAYFGGVGLYDPLSTTLAYNNTVPYNPITVAPALGSASAVFSNYALGGTSIPTITFTTVLPIAANSQLRFGMGCGGYFSASCSITNNPAQYTTQIAATTLEVNFKQSVAAGTTITLVGSAGCVINPTVLCSSTSASISIYDPSVFNYPTEASLNFPIGNFH